MRISRLEIENYKGIRRAIVNDLSSEPAVIITGKNGAGKSLLLEGILAAWSGNQVGERHDDCVGPWSDSAKVEFDITLTAVERQSISEWTLANHGYKLDALETVTRSRTWSGSPSVNVDHEPTLSVLTDPRFRRVWGFSTVDHIPPNRTTSIPTRASMHVDLSIFGEDRLEQDRKSHLESTLRWGGAHLTADVLTYLATVDYLDQIAVRSGANATNEFDILAANFQAATGKIIHKPRVDVNAGVSIVVETPIGDRHEIADLSVGEHEVLNLMYLVRRLSARGGILLIDEPEQHLHPTLQAALFETMMTLADRAQVIAVSHSSSLIASVPSVAVLGMSGPYEDGRSQLVRTADDRGRSALLSELGLRPSALVQSDALIIVEGNSDEAILRSLFPIELSRCKFVVAGGVNEVMTACKSLGAIEQVIPWLCIRDRDLADREERAGLISSHANLFVWNSRMLENALLDSNLVSETFIRAGFNKSPEEVSAFLRVAADGIKDEVLHQLVQKRLVALSPVSEKRPSDDLERLKFHYSTNIKTMEHRLAMFDEVVADVEEDLERRWDSEWCILAHGKRLMAELVRWSPFGNFEHLVNALAATYTQGSSQPADLLELGVSISEMLSS